MPDINFAQYAAHDSHAYIKVQGEDSFAGMFKSWIVWSLSARKMIICFGYFAFRAWATANRFPQFMAATHG